MNAFDLKPEPLVSMFGIGVIEIIIIAVVLGVLFVILFGRGR